MFCSRVILIIIVTIIVTVIIIIIIIIITIVVVVRYTRLLHNRKENNKRLHCSLEQTFLRQMFHWLLTTRPSSIVGDDRQISYCMVAMT